MKATKWPQYTNKGPPWQQSTRALMMGQQWIADELFRPEGQSVVFCENPKVVPEKDRVPKKVPTTLYSPNGALLSNFPGHNHKVAGRNGKPCKPSAPCFQEFPNARRESWKSGHLFFSITKGAEPGNLRRNETNELEQGKCWGRNIENKFCWWLFFTILT